jgi:uncharacterized protein (DUF779 family)
MPQQITATPAALALLERLRAEHGDLIVHVSGGCCDGSSPMCLRAAGLPASPHDVQLGALADGPVVLVGDQNRRWEHPASTSTSPLARPAASRSRRWRSCTSAPRRTIP